MKLYLTPVTPEQFTNGDLLVQPNGLRFVCAGGTQLFVLLRKLSTDGVEVTDTPDIQTPQVALPVIVALGGKLVRRVPGITQNVHINPDSSVVVVGADVIGWKTLAARLGYAPADRMVAIVQPSDEAQYPPDSAWVGDKIELFQWLRARLHQVSSEGFVFESGGERFRIPRATAHSMYEDGVWRTVHTDRPHPASSYVIQFGHRPNTDGSLVRSLVGEPWNHVECLKELGYKNPKALKLTFLPCGADPSSGIEVPNIQISATIDPVPIGTIVTGLQDIIDTAKRIGEGQ
jgi:hypothetical protein